MKAFLSKNNLTVFILLQVFDWFKEFSFSLTGCLIKTNDSTKCLPCYSPIFGGRIVGFISFPKSISSS